MKVINDHDPVVVKSGGWVCSSNHCHDPKVRCACKGHLGSSLHVHTLTVRNLP